MTVIEYMTVVGFAGLFFSAGFAVGKIVERLINSKKQPPLVPEKDYDDCFYNLKIICWASRLSVAPL